VDVASGFAFGYDPTGRSVLFKSEDILSHFFCIESKEITFKELNAYEKMFSEVEMDKRHPELKDNEITRIYDKTYGHAEERARGSELAEEMVAAGAIHEEKGNW